MCKKLFRRLFHKKVKTGSQERFETLFKEATKVTPRWIANHKSTLLEIARREDTVTDATIVLYRDRRGILLSCEYQRSGKKVGMR